jgi:hypothetical protein
LPVPTGQHFGLTPFGLNSRSATGREKPQATQRGKAAAEIKTALTQRRKKEKALLLCVSALILLSLWASQASPESRCFSRIAWPLGR